MKDKLMDIWENTEKEKLALVTKSLENWIAPGPDQEQLFGIKYPTHPTIFHPTLTKLINSTITSPIKAPT